MPISWKGTLQQYAGRLHRQHADKQDVRIYDYAETDQPQLARMWKKRQRGYRAMGYHIKDPQHQPATKKARPSQPGFSLRCRFFARGYQ
jgi:superfamily II DNA or RNA helicase